MANIIFGNHLSGDYSGRWNVGPYTRGHLIVQTQQASPVIQPGWRLKRLFVSASPEFGGRAGIALYLLPVDGSSRNWQGAERIFETWVGWPPGAGVLPFPAQYVTGTENGMTRMLVWNGDFDLSGWAGRRVSIGVMSPTGPPASAYGRWGPWQRLGFSYFFASEAPTTSPGGIPGTWPTHFNSAASPCVSGLIQDEPGELGLEDPTGGWQDVGEPDDPFPESDPPEPELPPAPDGLRFLSIGFCIPTVEFYDEIAGLIQWPWLDFGEPGRDKQLVGFDLVGEGRGAVQVGYDQRHLEAFTPAFVIEHIDTLPGQVIPLPVTAPTLSFRLTFERAPWKWEASTIYVADQRRGA